MGAEPDQARVEAVNSPAALAIAGLIGSAIVIGLGLLLGSAFVLREYGLDWTIHAIGEMLR